MVAPKVKVASVYPEKRESGFHFLFKAQASLQSKLHVDLHLLCKMRACTWNSPVVVPPDVVDTVTTTFLPRVPFRMDTVTLALPASSI